MKKSFFLGLMSIIMGMFVFAACGDDDDEKTGSPIEGTWTTGYTQELGYGTVTWSETYEFKSNKTFVHTMSETYTYDDGETPAHAHGNRESGTYAYQDGKLSLTTTKLEYQNPETGQYESQGYEESYTQYLVATIEGNRLILASRENPDEVWGEFTKR